MIFAVVFVCLGVAVSVDSASSLSCPPQDGALSIYLPDNLCSRFWQCSNGIPYLQICPADLYFSYTLNVCVEQELSGCTNRDDDLDDSGERCPLENPDCPLVDGEQPVYIPLPNCTQFCQCSNGDAYLHNCPGGLHFNPSINVCDWPENAGCGSNGDGGNGDGGNEDGGNGETVTERPGSEQNDDSNSDEESGSDDSEDSDSDSSDESGDDSNDNGERCPLQNPDCPAVDGEHSVYIPLPNCTQFCQCSNGDAYLHNCPDDLHFNPTLNVCDWPEDAGCASNDGSSSTTKRPGGNDDDESNTTERPGDNDDGDKTTTARPQTDDNDTSDTTTKGPGDNDDNNSVTTEGPGDDEDDDKTTTEIPQNDDDDSSDTTTGKPGDNDDDDSITTENPGDNEGDDETTTDGPLNEDDDGSDTTTDSGQDDEESYERCPLENPDCPVVDGEHPVYIPLPNCTQFCQCSNGDAYLHNCPDDLHFNPTLNVCDWPEDAGCASNDGNPSTTEGPGDNDDDDSNTTEEPGDNEDDDTTTENPENDDDDDDGSDTTTEGPGDNDDDNSITTEGPGDNEDNDRTTTEGPQNDDDGGSDTTTDSGQDDDESYERCPLENPDCPAIDGEHPVYIPLPNCSQFCQCSNGDAYLHNCPDDLHFNPTLNVCDWPEDAGCASNDGNSSTTEGPDDNDDESNTSEEPEDNEDDNTTTENPQNDDDDNDGDGSDTTTEGPVDDDGDNSITTENPDDNDGDDRTTTEGPQNDDDDDSDTTTDSGQDDESYARCPLENPDCPAVDGEYPVYIPLSNCSQFCQCSNGDAYLHNCPDDLHFNPTLNVCDWPEDAGCASNDGNPSTTEGPNDNDDDDSNTTENPGDNEDDENTTTESPQNDDDDDDSSDTTTKEPEDNDDDNSITTEGPGDNEDNDDDRTTTEGPQNDDDDNSDTTTDSGQDDDESYERCPLENPDCPAVDGDYPVYIPLPNCSQFCQCSNGDAYLHNCPDDLHFNPTLNVCDWPEDAGCASNDGNPSTTEGPNDNDNDDSNTTENPGDNEDDDNTTTQSPQNDDDNPNATTERPGDDGDDGSVTTEIPDDDDDNSNTPERPDDDEDASTTSSSSEEDNNNGERCPLENPGCPAVDGQYPVYIPLANCRQFCQCSNGDAYLHNCPADLHFNPVLNVCDYPEDAGCTGEGGNANSTKTEESNKNDGEKFEDVNRCPLEDTVCPTVDGEDPVYFALPGCSQFCLCQNGSPFLYNCPLGRHFNPVSHVCDWPESVRCNGDLP